MLAKLKNLWTRSRPRQSAGIVYDRRSMTHEEREQAEFVQRDGAVGEVEALLVREARHRAEREEGRSNDY